jgi:hypothetical protein
MSIIARLWVLFRAAERTLRLPLIILVVIIGGLLMLDQGARSVIFYSIF